MGNLIEFPLHRISRIRLTLDAVDQLRALMPSYPFGGQDEPPQARDLVVLSSDFSVPAEKLPRR